MIYFVCKSKFKAVGAEEKKEEEDIEDVEGLPICCVCNSEAGSQDDNPPYLVAFLSKTKSKIVFKKIFILFSGLFSSKFSQK